MLKIQKWWYNSPTETARKFIKEPSKKKKTRKILENDKKLTAIDLKRSTWEKIPSLLTVSYKLTRLDKYNS